VTRSRHHTAWAGAFAVAAEPSRREYDAAITLGNTPTRDLLCTAPSGDQFAVHVKSAASRNWIPIQRALLEADPRDDLYLIVVLVPSDVASPFEYHILTHPEACNLFGRQRKVRLDGLPYKPGMEGLSWAEVRPHRDRWDKLPA
jgi:hypothetical protein